jgi:hypothetical protein
VIAEEADGRSSEIERRLALVERRAIDAEMQLSEAALRRADASAAANRSLLALEHVRLEREWSDVVGPGVPPPVPWDGSLHAAIGTELAIIRETMGAPGQVGGEPAVAAPDPAHAVLAMRLATELLRLLARDGGEMRVSVGPGQVTVEQDAPAGPPAGLDELSAVASGAGASLSVAEHDGWMTIELRFPGA